MDKIILQEWNSPRQVTSVKGLRAERTSLNVNRQEKKRITCVFVCLNVNPRLRSSVLPQLATAAIGYCIFSEFFLEL